VDVRRVEPRLAAVGACPGRLRADQAHAGARAVEVHLVGGGEQSFDVVRGEEVGRAVRTVEDAELPGARQRRAQLGCERPVRRAHAGDVAQPQHVAGAQHAGRVAAEAAEREGRAAAQVDRRVEAVVHREVGTLSRTVDRSQGQNLSCRDRDRRQPRDARAIERRRHRCPGEADGGRVVEAQGWTGERHLERCCVRRIVEQAVGEAVRQRVHRAARRHADGPVADAPGPVLQARLRARREHVHRRCRVGVGRERARADPSRCEQLRGRDRPQVVEVGRDAVDLRGFERGAQLLQRGRAVAGAHDELGEHRVVERAHLGAGLDPGIDARVVWEGDVRQAAGAGQEALAGILRVEPHLDRCAARLGHARLEPRQLVRCLTDHPLDQVDAGDLLGDAVLDLQAGVDLEEVKRLAGVVVDELDRARGRVPDVAPEADRRVEHRGTRRGGQVRGRGLLDDLLVAPLQRAVALAERHHRARAVAEDLHLDVARAVEVLLEVDGIVLEVALAETPYGVEQAGKILGVAAELQPDAAAARRALDHHRVADALGRGARLRDVAQQAGARQQRHAARRRGLARGVLESEDAHVLGARPDEAYPGLGEALGEAGVLAQEAVARMNRFGAAHAARRDDALDVEVALRHRRRPDADRLAGECDVTRVPVGLRVDRDARDAEAIERAQDPAGDRAAVGDQDLAEHQAGAAKISTSTGVGS